MHGERGEGICEGLRGLCLLMLMRDGENCREWNKQENRERNYREDIYIRYTVREICEEREREQERQIERERENYRYR